MAETWVFSGPNNTPTEAEKRLIAAAGAGEVADCSGLSKTERVVSASLLVAVATGKYQPGAKKKWSLHDSGVRLFKAAFHERVEAGNRAFPAPLLFLGCRFSRGVDFTNAVVDGNMRFDDCLLAGESCFAGAEIKGQFNANSARFLHRGSTAVFAQGVHAEGWFMDRASVYGAFDINSAEIAGQFSAEAARFLNRGGRAVFAQGVRAGDWFMDRARVCGSFGISSAVLIGQFSANSARFLDRGARAVFAQEAHVRDWLMRGARVYGGFAINDAVLSGEFDASDARFLNRGGEAIIARYVQARHWVLDSARVYGDFSINGAVLTGQFSANSARLLNRCGDAINAFSADIRGGVFLCGQAICRGSLSMASATVGHLLNLEEAELDAGEGETALALNHARIEGELRMPLQLSKGIVDLSRAHAATLVDASHAWSKPLDQKCGDVGRLTRGAEGQPRDIQHLVLDGFTYDHIEYPAGDPEKPASAVGKARIDWLCGQSARDLKQHFNPQPWKQCAKVLREMGYAKAAQEVLIAMRVRERHADGVSLWDRLTNRFLHLVADYGYDPWKTVMAFGILVLVSASVFWGGQRLCNGLDGLESRARVMCAGQPAFVQTKFNDFEEVLKRKDGKPVPDPDIPNQFEKHRPGYPAFNPLWYSLDVALPLMDMGSESYWRANTRAFWGTPWLKQNPVLQVGPLIMGETLAIGWALYLWSVFEMVLGALLLAIMVTGFTGLLTRGDEK